MVSGWKKWAKMNNQGPRFLFQSVKTLETLLDPNISSFFNIPKERKCILLFGDCLLDKTSYKTHIIQQDPFTLRTLTILASTPMHAAVMSSLNLSGF